MPGTRGVPEIVRDPLAFAVTLNPNGKKLVTAKVGVGRPEAVIVVENRWSQVADPLVALPAKDGAA